MPKFEFPEVGQTLGETFFLEVSVRWADIDRFGHANNVAYWRWCEDARNEQAVAIGLGQPGPKRPSQIVVSSQAEYIRPVGLGDRLKVQRNVLKIGNTSQDAQYLIWQGSDLVFRAVCTIVLYDFEKESPVPYPKQARDRLLG